MARNEIICCSSAAVRLEVTRNWLASRLGGSEVLVVGSTRTSADEFARQTSGTGSLGIHSLSRTQVTSELALLKSDELGLAPLSRLGEEAVAARITHRLNMAGDLEYFRPVAEFPGFASALASTIYELRLAGFEAATMAAAPGALTIFSVFLRLSRKNWISAAGLINRKCSVSPKR